MGQTNNMQVLFSSKVNTLLYLKDKLSASKVLDLYSFAVSEYINDRDSIIKHIATLFCDEIIIRSSASTEDKFSTNAGHFSSVQRIDSQSRLSIEKGIETVINSYKKDGLSNSELIFIQKQLCNVCLAGVALSFEPDKGKPYFFINYDSSGSTDAVTSGKCKQYMYIARDFFHSNSIKSRLCKALLEVEELCNDKYLNVEFAITTDKTIYILQVRRFKISSQTDYNKDVFLIKNQEAAKYTSKKELLSDMAFWNPSEIIGDAPHPLDYSLYDYLVTEHAWNDGIAEMGYFSTYENLMTKIGNKPYIRLNIAFSALTPSSISVSLREKLKDYYSQSLLMDTNLHDKIEFEVVHTCFDFSTENVLLQLQPFGFTAKEMDSLSSELFRITESVIKQYMSILKFDLEKLSVLESALEKAMNLSDLQTANDMLTLISKLMPLIRDFGVVPFARQARCAFIARSICLSLVKEGYVSNDRLDDYMRSIQTIASELCVDVFSYKNGILSKDFLLNKYGHLRSNTYDISSPTYREIGLEKIINTSNVAHRLPLEEKQKHKANLRINFPGSKTDISHFVKEAIRQREYFKFAYSKSLSFLLEIIAKFAYHIGLSRDDISYLSIKDLLALRVELDYQQELHRIICKNRENYYLNSFLILPSVITNSEDFDVIKVNRSSPNYITTKCVEGEIILLENLPRNFPDISGKIVVIQNADPGFDWIFATGSLLGLITKYGGMASHMAIRCMEFGIPAAIGCGDLIYNEILRSKRACLDCTSKRVVTIE